MAPQTGFVPSAGASALPRAGSAGTTERRAAAGSSAGAAVAGAAGGGSAGSSGAAIAGAGAAGSAGVVGAAGASAGAPAAGSPATLPPPPAPEPLVWTRCGSFECSTLKVPLDYAAPAGDTIELALERRSARAAGGASEQKLGSLLLNPGGPGGSAVDFLEGFAAAIPTLADRFDLVAFDPRGVGASTPLDCHSTVQELIGADPTPDGEAEWMEVDQGAATFAGECAEKYPNLLPFLGTPNVARDMDQVRAALGDEKLTYLGFSYGTAIGAWYAELFPQRVRALVLDGAVDVQLSAVELSVQQAKGFESSLGRFFDWCGESASNCSWAGNTEPREALLKLMAAADSTPIPAPSADRPAGPGELLVSVVAPLYSGEDGYRTLSNALDDAVNGDGSAAISITDNYMNRRADGTYGNIQEANYAVNCVDAPVPDVAALRGMEAQFAAQSPTFGVALLTGLLVCAHWPVMNTPPPAPRGAGAAPILVVGTTGDPATPYAWAQRLAEQLESGALLTYEGEGHTAYGRGDPCIDDAVESYLIDLQLPAAEARCGSGGGLSASRISPFVVRPVGR